MERHNEGADNALLLREFDLMLKSDHGRGRILKALPGIVADFFDHQNALRILILRTMPYRQYLKTLHWRSVSAAAKDRAGLRCQLCNSPERLETHHRTYVRRGCEDPLDVTVLCDSCHKRFHNEPLPDEPDASPKMSPEEEMRWLTELVERKRMEQGITPPLNPKTLSQTLNRSGMS